MTINMYMKDELKKQILIDSHYYGTFMGIWYQPESVARVIDWAESNQLSNITPPEDIHTTIHFSRKGNKRAERSAGYTYFKVKSIGLGLLGENNDILVILLDPEPLRDLHDDLKKQYGLVYDWPEYKPHITIKYDFQGNIEDLTKPNLELMTMRLNVSGNDPKYL